MNRRSSPPNASVTMRERISISFISWASLGIRTFATDSSRGLRTGDITYNFVKLAGPLTNVFNRDAFVVAMHAFVFRGGGVNRSPAVSDNAELPIELAFSITAQHLGSDNRARMILFGLPRDQGEQFGVCRGAVGRFEAVDVLDLDCRIGDDCSQRFEKLVRRFAGKEANVEIARSGVWDNVCLLSAAEHRDRDRVAQQKVELALTAKRLREARILQRLANVCILRTQRLWLQRRDVTVLRGNAERHEEHSRRYDQSHAKAQRRKVSSWRSSLRLCAFADRKSV